MKGIGKNLIVHINYYKLFFQKSDQKPKPQPRSKMPTGNFNLPDLPPVPSGNDTPTGTENNEDIDFDDLMKRFEDLKKKK